MADEFQRGENGYEDARRVDPRVATIVCGYAGALPHALSVHCAEKYANPAALLPELWERMGQSA